MIIRKLIAAACFAAGAAGCVHTDVYRVARFRPGAAAVHAPAPVSGVYRVRYATSGGDLQNLAESERIVRKGEPLGFRVAGDGTLLAVAGAEEFAVGADPRALRKCVWYGRSEKPSQFSREVYKAANATGRAALTAGVGAGLATVVVGTAALDNALERAACDDDDDDCRDDDAGSSGGGGGHGHHGGGGGGPKPPKPGGGGGTDKPARPGSRNP